MSGLDGPNHLADEAEETGLNLFDDRASAVGSFPHAMFGYERVSVDGYVRDLEQKLSTFRQLTRQLRREMHLTQLAAGDSDFSRLGAHATSLLRAAEAQAQDLVNNAANEAERIKEEGRRVAADLRANAQTESDEIKVSSLANLRLMREQLERQVTETLSQSKAEAAAAVDAARRHADALIQQAQTSAATILAEAQAKAESAVQSSQREAQATTMSSRDSASQLLADARSEAAQIVSAAKQSAQEIVERAQSAAEETSGRAQTKAVEIIDEAQHSADKLQLDARTSSEETLAETSRQADEARARTDAMLAAATQQHAESTQRLQEEAEQASRIRQAALSDAEQAKTAAARESEAQIAAAHRQAAMMKDRMEEQYGWRKEQLQREINALLQRKDSVLAELSNIQALAQQSATDFPNSDPLANFDSAAAAAQIEQSADAGAASAQTAREDDLTAIIDRDGAAHKP